MVHTDDSASQSKPHNGEVTRPTVSSAEPPPRQIAPQSYHSPHAPFPQSPFGLPATGYYPTPPMNPYAVPAYTPEPEPENEVSKATALLTVGSALGLTAAAAVRWLNGGDFQLFPPALVKPDSHFPGNQERQIVLETGDSGEASTEESNDDSRERQLVDQVESLVETLRTQTSKQEQMILRLARQSETKLTDQSVNLLRKDTNTESAASVSESLRDIRQELSNLHLAIAGLDEKKALETDWESRLKLSIDRLDSTLARIKPEAEEEKPTVADSEKVHTSALSIGASESVSTTLLTDSATSSPSLLDAIRQLAEQNEPRQLRDGAQLLYLYVVNLASNPRIPRYRKIYTTNESFQKVDGLVGGKELLTAVGFADQGNCLEWLPSHRSDVDSAQEESYVLRLKEAAEALGVLKSSTPNGEKNKLAETAVLAATPVPPPASTPVRQEVDHQNVRDVQPTLLHTPEIGSIISPPITKKQALFSPSQFAPHVELMTPQAASTGIEEMTTRAIQQHPSGPKLPDSVEVSGVEATNAVWK